MTEAHKPCPDAMPLAQMSLDKAAKGILILTRHFMTSFEDPETQAWQMAFVTAQERWDEQAGPQIAMKLLALLQSMRRIRSRTFHFANPLCLSCREWLTPDEADLLSMLQAMRRDRTGPARSHLADLTEGRMDPVVITHALALAKALGPVHLRPSLVGGTDTPKATDKDPRITHPALLRASAAGLVH